ncbi:MULTISPECIES: hypothetical protein [unclassified Thermosipho (in: thermotogales)]|uniref:hypothetical protein n=1 Tax=unclassified Thermosipho (in: thermotogales) TaxID=2676525 RepID=UPI000949482F|nr:MULTISPECIES: hypothetical protein [unclassified Thermosipho (in: thermotogales)]ANQ54680.1 hypothetical protein Y592_08725 [Thermosipho sp. 1070]
MYDLSHIKRILKMVKRLATHCENEIDMDLIIYGAYFHGILYEKEKQILKIFKTKELSKEKINKIIQVSWKSQKKKNSCNIIRENPSLGSLN